jgi:hypothetical protein
MQRLIDHISSRLAFFPPTPASYGVQAHTDNPSELYIQPTDT